MSRSSWFSFWPSFLFIFFLKWAKSHSASSKVLCCYSPFYSPSFWFPEGPSTCAVRDHSRFSSFSCSISGTWEGRIHPLFLVFFWIFLWAVLILSWLCYTPQGSRAFGSLWGSWLSFLFTLVIFQSSNLGFFSFSSFFSYRLPGLSFSLWFLGFKPFGLTISFHFPWPLMFISLGLGAVIFWTSTNICSVEDTNSQVCEWLQHH